MRYLFLIILSSLFSLSGFANDLSRQAKLVIFNEISEIVFYEDEGMMRLPSKIDDFQFVQESDAVIRVTGTSYSQWDMKDLEYDCEVKVVTKSVIKSSKDIEVICDIKNENWPYFN